ncbi:DUF5947 family protein [Streptomyces beihaiensis]|uniref:DUF5947 family protein n=1 Tax=Streptomyces beihaiensis TaxID=2984495 RepID=A0ABT3U3V7_9ACTN|nr:DUF5947 family protein [Streptomyces beihaiensis]MCX3062878.1 DUF5947 family protein [Streptomyces beihaiensis]
MTGPARTRGLRRFTAPRPPAVERCELCSLPVPETHRHLVDSERRALVCACTACALLFDREGSGTGRFRTIPGRWLSEPEDRLDQRGWHALGVPVDVAFFFRDAARGRLVALYPSPAGATESQVDPAAWDAAFAGSALAHALAEDVEVLLARRTDERVTCHLVPVDAAYALVGRLRRHWRGFDGGPRARAELDAFFAEVDRRSVPAPAPAPPAASRGATP